TEPETEPSVPIAESGSPTELSPDDAVTEQSHLTGDKEADIIKPDAEVELGASNNDEEETGESELPSNIDADITKLGAEEEWGVTENSGEQPETEETEDHDEFSDESGKEEETDKVEWNWGDELREEFGIPPEEEVDARYEMVDNSESPERNEIELVDEFLDEETTRKDLFRQLEKTLERELKTEKKPGLEFTSGDKKLALTSDRDTLKKVILEFSGPPSKYEFVEDRSAEKEKRMAITLINETSAKTSGPAYKTEEEISGRDKNNYSKNLIIISAVMLVLLALIAAVIFFVDRSSKKDDTAGKLPGTETNTAAEQSLNSPAESQQLTDNGGAIENEEMSDFPRTATPPVPIKDATDRQILETIKRETAKIETSGKESSIQSGTQRKPVTGNPELYKSATSETKINNRIFYDGKNFNLQISSWPNRARAEEEVNRLRGDGFNAFIVEANLPQKGGLWFRVRIGPFKSEKEANDFLTKNNF
ncbi:MAG: SPOR domain-containing protein, partial [Melioribacteraceae bacterium]